MNQKVVLTESQINKLNVRRKRSINLNLTENEVRKRNRNTGQPYISATGAPVPGKMPAEAKACKDRCQKEGCLFDNETKEGIFVQYYSNGSYNLQTTFLLSCLMRHNPHCDEDEENHRRMHTFKYYLPHNGTKSEVCLSTFKSVLQIKEKRVRVIQQKLLEGEFVGNDRRGNHDNRPNRLNLYLKELMRNHIQSFPTTLSHYKRNVGDPLRQYLPPGLNLNKMFRLFVESNPGNIRAPFLQDSYSKIFKKSGLRFAKLRSDTCSTCDKLLIAEKYANTELEQNNIRLQIEDHHDQANLGYTQMKADFLLAQVDASLIVLCVDLQQVLFTPTLTHKEIFYMRQFSSYNYCITNAANGEATMCYWTETMATRGSEEMLSCLWRYITENFHPLPINEKRKLVIWSDRCSGQNNNFVTLCFTKLLVYQKFFTSIDQKFLCSGHSFLVCDRLFGLIEKQKKISKVYVPDDWIHIFRQARPTQPFRIQVMVRENFFAFDDLLEIIPKPHTLKVSQVLWFRVTEEDISAILSKDNHHEAAEFVRHQITQPFTNGIRYADRAEWEDEWLENIGLRLRNPTELAIDAKKYADLMKMLEYLEPQYREFYRNLQHF